ncbi:MAG: tyrosine-type recombinase/integrase, partial [Nitrospinaceae bacterium]
MQDHIEKFKTHLVAEKSASEHTVESYLNDLHQFSLFLKKTGHACNSKGRIDIKQIDRLAVRSYMVHLHGQGFTGTTMSRKLSSLSSFFKFLCREGYLPNNVVKSIPAPKKEHYLPSFLSVDDIFRLLELPDAGTFIGVRDRSILEMFYSTGMRISELVTLQMDFIDLESQSVRVLGKGKKERWLPLGGKAISALSIYLSRREILIRKKKPDPLPSVAFLNTRGNGLTTRGVRKIVGKYLDQLVSGRHSPHS